MVIPSLSGCALFPWSVDREAKVMAPPEYWHGCLFTAEDQEEDKTRYAVGLLMYVPICLSLGTA